VLVLGGSILFVPAVIDVFTNQASVCVVCQAGDDFDFAVDYCLPLKFQASGRIEIGLNGGLVIEMFQATNSDAIRGKEICPMAHWPALTVVFRPIDVICKIFLRSESSAVTVNGDVFDPTAFPSAVTLNAVPGG